MSLEEQRPACRLLPCSHFWPIMHSSKLQPGQLSLADFDFDLPPELIAQHPAAERSASRLLDARTKLHDRRFSELPSLLREGDLLVFNDTEVLKARLFGVKPSGGTVELLVERVLEDNRVAAHMRANRKPASGTLIRMHGGFEAEVLGRWPDARGELFELRMSADPYELMRRHGHVPLPPYIKHEDDVNDADRYQTVFARVPGSVAAPTAALHFDEALLDRLRKCGIRSAHLTLHVGAGTFQPVKVDDPALHRMHSERFFVPGATLQAIAETRNSGGRVIAVGTTTVRALESVAHERHLAEPGPGAGTWNDWAGETDIFITPGHRFAWIDMLVTNFHLPRSTLLMLVSAFAGMQVIRDAYAHALANRYRFFSYGDAMLLACCSPINTTAESKAPPVSTPLDS